MYTAYEVASPSSSCTSSLQDSMLISSEAIGKRARLVTFAHPRDSGTKGSRRHSTRGNNASGRSQEPCHLFGLRVRQKPSTCLFQKKKKERRRKKTFGMLGIMSTRTSIPEAAYHLCITPSAAYHLQSYNNPG